MSDSDDAYGPPLPPGLSNKKVETDSSDDQYGPPLPKKSRSTNSSSDNQPVIGPVLPTKGSNLNKYSSDSDSSSSDSSDSDDASKRKRKSHKSKKSDYRKSGDKSTSANKDIIGPYIPRQSVESGDNVSHRSIGPLLPPGLLQNVDHTNDEQIEGNNSDDGDIGPSIHLQASEGDCSAAAEFEGRSQKMLKQLTTTSDPEDEKPIQRETWMTELPDHQQIGVSFGLTNRQFRSRDADEIDSSWAKTPQEVEEESSKEGKKKKKKKYEHAQSDKNTKAAKEIEEYNKKHRPKSLLEMHQKKLEKKKKKEKKKNKDKKPERRAFDRDLDLKVNQLDDAQRRAFIKRTQDLGGRFKTGGTGTSFM